MKTSAATSTPDFYITLVPRYSINILVVAYNQLDCHTMLMKRRPRVKPPIQERLITTSWLLLHNRYNHVLPLIRQKPELLRTPLHPLLKITLMHAFASSCLLGEIQDIILEQPDLMRLRCQRWKTPTHRAFDMFNEATTDAVYPEKSRHKAALVMILYKDPSLWTQKDGSGLTVRYWAKMSSEGQEILAATYKRQMRTLSLRTMLGTSRNAIPTDKHAMVILDSIARGVSSPESKQALDVLFPAPCR